MIQCILRNRDNTGVNSPQSTDESLSLEELKGECVSVLCLFRSSSPACLLIRYGVTL